MEFEWHIKMQSWTSMPIGEWANTRVKKRLSQKTKQRADHAVSHANHWMVLRTEGQNMAYVYKGYLSGLRVWDCRVLVRAWGAWEPGWFLQFWLKMQKQFGPRKELWNFWLIVRFWIWNLGQKGLKVTLIWSVDKERDPTRHLDFTAENGKLWYPLSRWRTFLWETGFSRVFTQ